MSHLQIVVLGALLIAAGITDFRTRRIPNLLIAFGLAFGLGMAYSLGDWPGVRVSLGGIGVALALFVPVFLLRALGAGDVKLMMVVGSFLGPASTITVSLFAFAAGGVLALVHAFARRRLGSLFRRTRDAAFALAARDVALASSIALTSATRIPFAVAILIGATVWLFYFH